MTVPTEKITLVCLDEEHAKAVYEEAHRPGDLVHNVERDGKNIVISFHDKRWPLDVADWAGENGHASDSAAGRLIGRL